MTQSQPKFQREPASVRKDTLIRATLALIAEQGIRGATVRAIAKQANVTQGLIRHHFSSKEDLIAAAFRFHMENMTQLTTTRANSTQGSARDRLITFIATSLQPPIVDVKAVSLWAGFVNIIRTNDEMRETHQQTYYDFRNHLEKLIKATLNENDIKAESEKLRQLAIASNGVIDGLWMEGSALPHAFHRDELPVIGVQSVGAIIGIPMTFNTTNRDRPT